MSITFTRAAVAAAIAAASLAAQAGAGLGYSLAVGDSVAGNMQEIVVGDMPPGVFSTHGMLTLGNDTATASLSALADPATGMFKSFSSVRVGGGVGSGAAQSIFSIVDTLTFNGPDATVGVTFDFHWDSVVSGHDAAFVPAVQDGPQPPMRLFWSTQMFGLNPLQPPAPSPCLGEPGCVVLPTSEPLKTPSDIYGMTTDPAAPEGVGDGRYTGSATLSYSFAAGTSVQLIYIATNASACYRLFACDLSVDATHSDYIGMTLSPGATFTSENGYRYLGIDAATAPVPEPATGLLALLGLGVVARRRGRTAA